MNKELGRNIIRATFVTVTFFEAVTHAPQPTRTAWYDMATPDPSCPEVMPIPAYYDAIAVFSAGSYKDDAGIVQPDSYQNERLKAAAAAYVAGYSNEIILIDDGDGGVLPNSFNILSESVKDLSDGAKNLSPQNVRIISKSVNTAENTQDLKKFMAENGLTKVLSISDLFHYKRLRLLLDNYDVNSDIAPTECIANEFIKTDVAMLNQRQATAKMGKMQNKEWWAIFELSIDPKGELSIAFKKAENFFRGQ